MSSLRRTLLISCVAGSVLALSASGCKSAPASQTGAASQTPTTGQTQAPKAWSEKMQSLSRSLSSLLPLVASRSKFSDPKNFTRIEDDTRKLRGLAHSLSTGDAPNADPSMRMMSGLFEEDISRALEALKTGNRDYARHILKDTTSYCIQCHTQTSNGPQFPHLNLDISINELSFLEQAEFYAATRQFDRALEAYSKALGSEELAKNDPFSWENAARSALAITVRVKNNAKETMEFLNRLETNKLLPESSQGALKAWKKSATEWQKEKNPTLSSPQEQLKLADSLIKKAKQRQEFPLDHSQDIPYFRASSLLHDLLQKRGRSDDLTANALYLAGIASEATRDMNFWTLHETYYEQCIRLKPKTPLARQCFDRLKDSVTLGYSGSAGLKLPPEVSKRLDSFRQMAM